MASSSGLDPTLPLETFHNDTMPAGGDSRLDNLNVFYNASSAPRYPLPSRSVLTPAGGRHRLDAYLDGARPVNDSRRGVFLLGTGEEEVCAFAAVAVSWNLPQMWEITRVAANHICTCRSVMATAVVSFQWFFWGYSLAFSHSAGKFIGDLDNIGLRNVLGYPSVGSPRIPDLMFCVYQGMFAAIT